jgi:hypothetical protein
MPTLAVLLIALIAALGPLPVPAGWSAARSAAAAVHPVPQVRQTVLDVDGLRHADDIPPYPAPTAILRPNGVQQNGISHQVSKRRPAPLSARRLPDLQPVRGDAIHSRHADRSFQRFASSFQAHGPPA